VIAASTWDFISNLKNQTSPWWKGVSYQVAETAELLQDKDV